MARLAVLFTSAAILTAFPFGSAGPACARKHWQQQSCIEVCKGKWGYPGMMMGSGSFGPVIQKAQAEDWSSMIASACGTTTADTPSATGPAAALGNSPATQLDSTAELTLASSSSFSSIISSAISIPSPTLATPTSSSEIVSSSLSEIATPSSVAAPTTSSSSTEDQPSSTSTSMFTPPAPTSTVEQAPPASSSTPSPTPAVTKAASSSSSSDSSSSSGSNGSGASDSDVQAYLSAHNSVRDQHGASALTWSNDAAAKAQQWANGCVFQHSGGSLGPFGENLAAGTGDGYGIPQAILSWSNEASQYNPSNPQASHFTQMVWKATTQVGCALAQCSGIFDASFGLAHFYVCEYSPQGNVIGEFAFITEEYARTCLIIHQSQPRDAIHEGWGRPGTRYEGIRFRRALLDTIPEIDTLAHLVIPTHPPLKPHARMIHHFRFILPLLTSNEGEPTPLHIYDSVIQLARISHREPTEEEFELGMDSVETILQILDECRLEMLEDSYTQLNQISEES
ncbi:hypothetical protein D9757_006371 [Collybiopsis confluens]|uniref:SCP domain-containing protein n=1 Tax=Collybiopsis confluens TaxID=2823264 RepID=A0A8H5HG52_9AGAR|nr:hypothetical protein D9757_006371 [Collybiopsis confluens]